MGCNVQTRRFLSLILTIFLSEQVCAQRYTRQLDMDAMNCPSDTTCKELSGCKRNNLASIVGQPRDCGLSNNNKRRICCPNIQGLQRPSTEPTVTTMSDCGGTNELQGFIIGSKPAKQGAWPWMVAIAMRKRDGEYEHICTAALITRRHVLSAAHCFDRRDPNLYVLRIGHVNLKLANDYSFSRLEVPDTYRRGKFYDDIAVLTLSREVNTHPICLPQSNELIDLSGKGTTVAGWGATKFDDPTTTSDKLMELPAIPVVTNSKCNEEYGKLPGFRRDFRQGISNKLLCAGTGSKNTCGGDNGGPLMYLKGDHWYVVGIVSFGVGGCGESNLPSGYTRVTSYLDWIHEKIRS